MINSNSKALTEFIVKEIKKQQLTVERDAKVVTELAEEVASYINGVIKDSKNIDDGCIIYPSFYKIINKLNELSAAQGKVNNRKQLIRDYKHQLYVINGYYTSKWLK